MLFFGAVVRDVCFGVETSVLLSSIQEVNQAIIAVKALWTTRFGSILRDYLTPNKSNEAPQVFDCSCCFHLVCDRGILDNPTVNNEHDQPTTKSLFFEYSR
jgi:hypothetical protein